MMAVNERPLTYGEIIQARERARGEEGECFKFLLDNCLLLVYGT